MENPAVVDAYLGAHQDVDLGAVTGRIPVVEDATARKLREQIEAEAEAELEATSTADTDQKGNA
jgi:branched-chain amino acid transport system ATP-binding protein